MPGEKPRGFKGEQSVQVTDRTIEQYRDLFSLPRDFFVNRGLILDVGAGFADLTEQVNKQYGDTGTRAIAIDPVYAFLAPTYSEFEDTIDSARLFPNFGYGRVDLSKVGSLSDEAKRAREELYNSFKSEAQDSGAYVAGSHQGLPFADESIDVVLGNNSIIRFYNREIIHKAVTEILRVLKREGEARIGPTPFMWDTDQDILTLLHDSIETPEQHAEYRATGRVLDVPMLRLFQEVEEAGCRIYLTVESDEESHQRYFPAVILRKDEQLPAFNTKDASLFELRKVHFQDVIDQYKIPSEVVWKREESEANAEAEEDKLDTDNNATKPVM